MVRRLALGFVIGGLLTCALAFGAAEAGAAAFTPAAGSPFTTAAEPRGLALGDLNGDGAADAVTANRTAGNLSVLLADERGVLTPATGSPVSTGGSHPVAAALADLNADGTLDALAANFDSNTVAVLLGNGSGGLAPPAKPTVGTNGSKPTALAVADFNGDGKLDFATANFNAGNVSVLLGDGSGGFSRASGSPYATPGAHPDSLAAGDFNGDAKQDVAVAYDNGVAVMLGNGAGRLTAAAGAASGLAPAAIAAADFNADGKLDVAAATTGATVPVLAGDGKGGLSALAGTPVATGGTAPSAIAAGDLDRDGDPDLAVANAGGDVSVLTGDGKGAFALAPGFPLGTGGGSPAAVALGDVNGDTRVDIAAADSATNDVGVLLAVPPPTFLSFPSAPLPGQQITFAYSSPGAIQAVDWDLNSDGSYEDAHGTTAVATFYGPGSYAISLRVTDIDGVVATATRFITVLPEPRPPAPALQVSAPVFGASLLAPFPIVRISGRVGMHGARIRRLAVDAPYGAKVVVRCTGRGCPFKRIKRKLQASAGSPAGAGTVDVPKLAKRYLRAGVVIEVSVSKAGTIGKYTRFQIRRRRPPARSDLCLASNESAPVQCPVG